MLARLQLYIFIIVVLSGAFGYWKSQIEKQALMAYNQKQIEQVLKDQQAFQAKMDELNSKQKDFEKDLTAQNNEIGIKMKSLEDYLYSAETKLLEKPATIILKNTVSQMKGNTKWRS